jgi:hypothetical protein
MDQAGEAFPTLLGQGYFHSALLHDTPRPPPPRSRLHPEFGEELMAPSPLPPLLRLCGKMELLDRLLLKLQAGGKWLAGWLAAPRHHLPALGFLALVPAAAALFQRSMPASIIYARVQSLLRAPLPPTTRCSSWQATRCCCSAP